MAPQLPQTSNNKLRLNLDLRVVVIVLLVVIAAMLIAWKPWSAKASDRTVEVTGSATVSATPDEFVFYPTYEFKNADKTAALNELSKKSDEIVAKLKDLGVPDKGIKTNSSGYDLPSYPKGMDVGELTYTLQLTVTTGNKELTQKVQDYLVSTAPTGSVSPQASFSDGKRKSLESQARNDAAKDARQKADEMAKNIGFKVGKVKAINDGQGFNGMPFEGRSGMAAALDTSATSSAPSLAVQPGENDLPYSVTVVYYIR
jgi:uncharacterized protein YggE